MGLVTPWSLGLAMIDTFLVLAKRPSNQRRVLSAVVLGDWVSALINLLSTQLYDLVLIK